MLKLFSTDLPDEGLNELKSIIARFFADRSIEMADRIWDEKGLTNEDMDEWLNAG